MARVDVNDLHRAGKLPSSPIAGAVPFASSAPKPDDDGEIVTEIKAAVDAAWSGMVARMQSDRKYAGEPTGYVKLDRAIDGIKAGDCIVIGGRTGVGKSILGINIALSTAKLGSPVLYVTLEMPTEQQAIRALLAWTRTESWRVKDKKLTGEDIRRIIELIPALCELPILFDDRQGRTIEAIGKTIAAIQKRLVASGKKLGMVVLDHMLLVKPTDARAPRRNQVEHVINACKELAITHKVPIVVLTQLNRESEGRGVKDRRPIISDLQESGAIEQAADAILLMFREDYYKPVEEHDHILELIIPKIRNGAPCVVKLRFDGAKSCIDNLQEDLDEEMRNG